MSHYHADTLRVELLCMNEIRDNVRIKGVKPQSKLWTHKELAKLRGES